MARTSAVRTPGVPVADGPDASPAADDGDNAGGLVTLTQAQLQAMLDRAAASAVQAQRVAQSNPRNPDADLPDASDIDPDKIERPTLSKQGYVVPTHYGRPAGETFSG